ncbi:PadR family transcriptional regulator [Propionispora hippei]|uniref:DNA-binding transcriptional regulator, PadR family n=1 Tax=Propionispora hippei DSM 15287 TaxID=1123003 RepID=A0A1M6F0F5_9FIRM|nr:PadR family transcriptional regulator [Propionispora hippei]SHI91126.1 DNA-binding transcriptional regulator, PadR family [Propionispora hippei DSM 15287]
MRTLKYAILGLLNRGPLTGYDITKEFASALGNFWSAKHSQIYPELKKLADEGLVVFHTVTQGEKLEKKLYTITPDGRKDFLQWLNQDEPLEPTPKDIFKLKTYFSDALPLGKRIEQFQSQLIKRREKLYILKNHKEKLYGSINPASLTDRQRSDYLVLQGAILREEAYVTWLRESIALLGS